MEIGGFNQYDSRYPQLSQPMQGATMANQDESFLQWLFNFKKEAITPLRNAWRGNEYDYTKSTWIESKSKLKVMNEDGITWSISLIESYMSPVYITTDFDDRSYNFTMRECSRFIWNTLCIRYKEFGLLKTDIPRVAEEIESKIRAILLGAKNNGYRDFFSTQHQSVETRHFSADQNQQQRPGIFKSVMGMFKRPSDGMTEPRNMGGM